nr:3'-5' exonuclease [Methanofollis sp. W23]
MDVETTGVLRRGEEPPRLVEAAWLVCDVSCGVVREESRLVCPEGFVIPPSAVQVHGITTARAREEGTALAGVLADLARDAVGVSGVVAHNLAYDLAVVRGECRRLVRPDPFAGLPGCCTMESTAAFCGIRRAWGYKWPRLSELYQVLFGEPCEEVHRALDDARLCAECYYALRRQGFYGGVAGSPQGGEEMR